MRIVYGEIAILVHADESVIDSPKELSLSDKLAEIAERLEDWIAEEVKNHEFTCRVVTR